MTLRQALVITLTAVGRLASGSALQISAWSDHTSVVLRIEPAKVRPGPRAETAAAENLAMAASLVALSTGILAYEEGHTGAPGGTTLTFPISSPANLLVIDDNVDSQQLIQRYLSGTHYHALALADPAQAEAMAAKTAPSAILLDIMLPGIDGWELLGRFRRNPTTRNIPIIVCTILPEEQLALALGASAFLRKPIEREELIATLARLAQQEARAGR
jgi:CheY-like chemotaxis protein